MRLLEELAMEQEGRDRCVVKLSTSFWSNEGGLHMHKTLRVLRRKSRGHNLLEEEKNAIGPEEAMMNVINLLDCEDGIYEVRTTNQSRDWETGMVDAYSLELKPVKDKTTP